MKRLGSVIVWAPKATREDVQLAIRTLVEAGLIKPGPTHEFDPTGLPGINEFEDDCGGPVWYIP